MDILFRTTKLEKDCNDFKRLTRRYGSETAKIIRRRLDQLRASANLAQVASLPQARCHELRGNRKGQLAVDADYPKRIVFVPYHDPIPRKPDGGLAWDEVTAIEIIAIEDYHG